jgi:hypothetical protein
VIFARRAQLFEAVFDPFLSRLEGRGVLILAISAVRLGVCRGGSRSLVAIVALDAEGEDFGFRRGGNRGFTEEFLGRRIVEMKLVNDFTCDRRNPRHRRLGLDEDFVFGGGAGFRNPGQAARQVLPRKKDLRGGFVHRFLVNRDTYRSGSERDQADDDDPLSPPDDR